MASQTEKRVADALSHPNAIRKISEVIDAITSQRDTAREERDSLQQKLNLALGRIVDAKAYAVSAVSLIGDTVRRLDVGE